MENTIKERAAKQSSLATSHAHDTIKERFSKQTILFTIVTPNLLLFFTSHLFAEQIDLSGYASNPGEEYFDFREEPTRYIENDRVEVGFNLAIDGGVEYGSDGSSWSVETDLTKIDGYEDAALQLQLTFPALKGKVNIKSVELAKRSR